MISRIENNNLIEFSPLCIGRLKKSNSLSEVLSLVDTVHLDIMDKTFVNWKIGNVERRIFLNLCYKLNKYFKEKQYGDLKISKNLYSNRLFYKNILDTNHSSGGLQISRNNKYGVCNGNLKVHGTKNLYILSPSVFPINGSANITLTLFALTHKFFLNIKKIIKKI